MTTIGNLRDLERAAQDVSDIYHDLNRASDRYNQAASITSPKVRALVRKAGQQLEHAFSNASIAYALITAELDEAHRDQ